MQKIILLLSITLIFPVISMDSNKKAFFDAVNANKVDEVKKLLAEKTVDINAKNENGDTALMIAVNKNYIEMVEELLHRYANTALLNKNGLTVLEMAIDAQNPQMVTTILNNAIIRSDIDKQNNKDGNTVLIRAVEKGNIDIIKAVLKEIPDPSVKNKNKKTAMIFAKTPEHSKWSLTEQKEIIELLAEAQNRYNLYEEVSKATTDINTIKAILTPSFKIFNTPNINRNFLILAINSATKDNSYNKDLIDLLIKHDADVNQTLTDGKTPLIVAIENMQLAVVKQLLDAGANPVIALGTAQAKLLEAMQPTIKEEAVFYEKIVDALQKVIPTEDEIALFDAIKEGDAPKVQQLLNAGEAIIYEKFNYRGRLRSVIEFALEKNKQEIVNIFKTVIGTRLSKAINDENFAVIQYLIPSYVPIELALIQAIKKNKLAVVNMILNTFPVNINKQDKDSNTPLMLAIKTNNKDIIQAILDKMPDQSLKNKNGETAMTLAQAISDEALKKQIVDLLNKYDLYQAIINRNLDSVKALVTSSVVDVNQPIKGGTPLLFAIQKGSPEIVEILLQNNAKPDLAASDGTMPLGLAQAKLVKAKDPAKPNYTKIIDLLNKAIAKTVPTESTMPTSQEQLISLLQKLTQKLGAVQAILKNI